VTRFARAERLPTSVTQPIYDSDTDEIIFFKCAAAQGAADGS